jgi:hypothetical protein
MLIANNQGIPSHGRGRRFNPYNAHHFIEVLETSLGSCRQYPAEQSKSRRGQRVDNVPRLFGVPWPPGHRTWASLQRYSHIRQSGDKYANWKWRTP